MNQSKCMLYSACTTCTVYYKWFVPDMHACMAFHAGDRTPLTNVVFMGMGEPLHNLESVLAAADIMAHPLGLHVSANKLTISTVGLIEEMRDVVRRSAVQVALSLHATTGE